MAEGSEYFPIGSVVVCEMQNRKVEGEVLAFDPCSKLIILKSPSSSGKSATNDVHIVNFKFVTNSFVKTEASGTPPLMPRLNFHKITKRFEANYNEKELMAKAVSAGVGPEGQKLFLAISKTYEDVSWDGDQIVVLNQVTISPPYRPENCKSSKGEDQAVNRIRKIVEKYFKDQLQKEEVSVTLSNKTEPVVAQLSD